jgi:hypothetical protein
MAAHELTTNEEHSLLGISTCAARRPFAGDRAERDAPSTGDEHRRQ